MMLQSIDHNFGTWRGAVRLGLSYLESGLGIAPVALPNGGDAQVHRLVFVCHGNICRSAFADVLARRQGYNSASFGLSTDNGKPADPEISAHAARMGIDLSAHRSTDMCDFEPRPGDFLLAMEVRHLRRLEAEPRFADFPRALLGSYARPAMPHLHDPFRLNAAYQAQCLKRISSAVEHLLTQHPLSRRGE